MKKLYTLMIAALATSAAFAVTIPPRQLDANAQKLDVKPIYGVQYTPEQPSVVVAKDNSVVPGCKNDIKAQSESNKLPSMSQWSPMGTAVLVEDAFTHLYSLENVTVEVEVEENIMTDGLYRLVNPYKPVAEALGGYYDDSTTHYLIVHSEVADQVWFEQFNTGMTLNSEDGECILSGAAYWKSKGETDQAIYNAGWFGKNIGGVITFGVDKLLATCANLDAMYYANRNGNFKIQLPGSKDYSISVEGTTCAADNLFAFQIKTGADVAKTAYYLLPGNYDFNDGNYSYIVEQGWHEFLQDTSEAIGFNLGNPQVAAGRYTLFVMAFDADGNYVNGDGTYFYKVVDEPENWYDYGMVNYGEDFIGSIYKIGPTEHQVLLQENKNVKGYFRLVNPYQVNFAGAENNSGHLTDHNHYIYIDAIDENEIMLEESPIGADWGYGHMSVTSLVYMLYDRRDVLSFDLAPYFGKLEAKDGYKLLTFPEPASLYFAETNEQHGEWFVVNQNDNFYLEIPNEPVGVENVVVDNEAAEYFNLQGMRVNAPEAGSLVIRRQGNNVSKIVVR